MGDANSVVSILSLWGHKSQGGGRGGGMYLFRLCLLALSACIIYDIYSMNIIIIVNIVPSRKYKKYEYSEPCSL